MQIKGIFFTVVLLSASAFTWEHPLKMTFSKLVINSDGHAELETRIFLDDLTEQLQRIFSMQQVDFSNTTTNGTQALQIYINQNFYFEQDGEKLGLWINAVSKNRLALVVNLSTTKALDTSRELFLVNTLLCDAFPVQTNNIRYLDENYVLNNGNPKLKIRFD